MKTWFLRIILAFIVVTSVQESLSQTYKDDFVNDLLFEQLECEVTELPNYLTLDNDTVYTIEIRLCNQSEKSKLLWFKNKEEITGCDFVNTYFMML